MSRFKQILKNHKIAIALAILTSIIVAFPQVYFRIDHRASVQEEAVYQGIELLPDSPWSARAREVQDGHPNFGSIYYKDGKDNPYLYQPLGSMMVGYMGKIFSLNINNTILLSRLTLTFIVFLLMYTFVFLFSRNKLASLASASVLLLADATLSFSGLKQLFHGISPSDFIRIARPVNPAMVYVLFFGFMVSFWQFYQKMNKQWLYGIISAILLGLNFYNYFYTWTYLYAFGGILVLILLIQKRWKDALKITAVFVGGVLVAIPYILNLYSAMSHPVYEEAGIRFGVVDSHNLFFVGFVVIVTLFIFLWKFPRENRDKYFFGLALLLTPFITANQQLITGKMLQVNHYHWFFHKPIAVIFVLIIVFSTFAHKKLISYRKALVILIIIVSIATGVFIQTASYYSGGADGGSIAIERQKYGPVMIWLNENVEKEKVVYGNDETSHITVIYTPLNVFYHRAAVYSLSATKARLLDVLFSFYRLRGISAKDSTEVFFAERKHISANIYGIYYRELLGSYEAIPNEQIEEVISLYKETLLIPTAEWLKKIWTQYEVEYIVWDKKLDPEWQLEKYSFLEEVAIFDTVSIYQFPKIN